MSKLKFIFYNKYFILPEKQLLHDKSFSAFYLLFVSGTFIDWDSQKFIVKTKFFRKNNPVLISSSKINIAWFIFQTNFLMFSHTFLKKRSQIKFTLMCCTTSSLKSMYIFEITMSSYDNGSKTVLVIFVGFLKVIVVVLFYDVCDCVSAFSCLLFAFMHWIGRSSFSLSTNFTQSSKQESILLLESKLWFFAPDTTFGLSVSKNYGIQFSKIFILVFKNVNIV